MTESPAPAVNSSMRSANLICEAITRRALLQFRYDDRLRVVAPYCHGVSTRDVEVLRAIQVRGESGPSGFGYGKLWTVAKMVEPRILQETFVANDPRYNPDDSGMKEIHCRV